MNYMKYVLFLVLISVYGVAVSQEGKAVYQQTCVACHGEDGKGVLPGVPDFTIDESRLDKPDSILLKNMYQGMQSEGSPMAMPAKGGNSQLTENDLKNVLVYMRTVFSQ